MTTNGHAPVLHTNTSPSITTKYTTQMLKLLSGMSEAYVQHIQANVSRNITVHLMFRHLMYFC